MYVYIVHSRPQEVVFWVFCCLSLNSLCHGVACPALTALCLSPLLHLFVMGGLSLLPRRPAFVMWHPHFCPRLVTCHEKADWVALFNHCIACVQLIRGAKSGRKVYAELKMGKLCFTRPYHQDGCIYIYARTSSNMGLGASQVLNPKWQLAGSGPSLPGATQTFPLPVCRAFMAGSPGSLSAMHYFAPSFSGREGALSSAQIPRRTFMEARWDSLHCTCLSTLH